MPCLWLNGNHAAFASESMTDIHFEARKALKSAASDCLLWVNYQSDICNALLEVMHAEVWSFVLQTC